ncbi:MAG: LysE family translocator [Candidatus Cyclobacteriaceae bacterium M2_1C_046]
MGDAILKGILFGLVLAMLIGPVFFMLIQTSIEKGFMPGFLVAVGISLSDTLYILISYFGLTNLLAEETMEKYLGLAGGVILVGFGIFSFFKSRKKREIKLNVQQKGFKRHIIKGFMVNGLNPMVLFFWIGAISLATIEYELKGSYILIFFISIILTVFITDLIKVYLAHKLRTFVTPRFIKILNIITGVVMVTFGIRLFIYAGSGF